MFRLPSARWCRRAEALADSLAKGIPQAMLRDEQAAKRWTDLLKPGIWKVINTLVQEVRSEYECEIIYWRKVADHRARMIADLWKV